MKFLHPETDTCLYYFHICFIIYIDNLESYLEVNGNHPEATKSGEEQRGKDEV